jgi:hypothetical protein
LIAAKTTEGRSLFAPVFLCEHSRNECPDLQVYNDGVEGGKPKPWSGLRCCDSKALAPRSFNNTTVASDRESQIASLTPVFSLGGSIKDDESIAAANENGIAMPPFAAADG